MSVTTVLIAILVFGVLIFVHELGHFLAAKWSGITVNEFALGMGPRIFSRTRGETTYALRLFPLGGFCAMEGDSEESTARGAFCNAPLHRRMLVMLAGSLMNALLGLIIVGILTSQAPAFGSTVVGQFEDNAVSSAALRVGDEITRMNGRRVRTLNDMNYEFSRVRGDTIETEVLRDGEKLQLTVPFAVQEIEGVNFISMDFKVRRIEKTFLTSVRYAFNWTGSLIRQVWGSLMDLLTGRYGVSQLSGPVGVTTVISQASAFGWKSLFQVVAIITLNLGVFNLLPLPALDGGRLIFLLLELVRRKPVDPKYEGVVHAVGFALLIGLMIFVTVNDVIKLI